MPSAPKTIRELRTGKKHPSDGRKSSCKRGYGRDWQRFRRDYLAMNPMCEDCKGEKRTTAAQELHHIKKVKDRPDLRLDPDNVMGLCKSHHSIRTKRGE